MPTALAPASWASCPTSDPTGPLAAATTTVSRGCGLPITRRPPYAVNPGIPSTPRPVVIGAAAGSNLRRPVPSESACVRHPVRARTTSPLTYAELFETSTCATVSPVITSPISSGVAYDFPSFIRPRIYGSRERYCTPSRSWPAAGVGIAVSSRRKSVSSGFPFGRAARTICRPRVVMTRTFSLSETHSSLHLCDPAIHEQLDSRDVATVVGREEHHRLGNLVGSTEAAEWHRGGDHLRALLACLRGGEQLIQSRGVGDARAHRVHPDAAILQLGRPCPCERADGGLRGTVHTVGRESLAADDRRVEDDRCAVRHQRKNLLHGEQQALHVDVKDRIVELFGDLAEGRVSRDAGIREQDVKPPLLPLDLGEQAVEIAEVRNIASDSGDVATDLLDRRRQLGVPPSSDEHVRALTGELLRRRQANSAIATGHERDLAVQLSHVSASPWLGMLGRRSRPGSRPSVTGGSAERARAGCARTRYFARSCPSALSQFSR